MNFSDWLFHRALRLSAATVRTLAKKTGQSKSRIVAVNDAVAGIAVAHANAQAGQLFGQFEQQAPNMLPQVPGP